VAKTTAISGGDVNGGARTRLGKFPTACVVIAGAILGYSYVRTQPQLLADEGFHAPQIWTFFIGELDVHRGASMLPTYHAIMAVAERLVGFHDDRLLRLLNLCGSLLVPLFLWRLVSLHSPASTGQRTVQWFFMPLLFPFFFLIYTDTWALAAILAMQFWVLRDRVTLAAIAGLIATALRQDMIIWVGMAWLLVVLRDADPRAPRDWRGSLVPLLLRGAPLMLVLLLFVAFYVWNGGVALGDPNLHRVGFNVTNVAYFLLCAWAIFLPLNVEALPRIWPLVRRPLCLWLLLGGFVLYMSTYANDHQFNSAGLRFYLHNEGLYWLTRYPSVRALAFVPMAWMVLTVCVTPLPQARMRILFLIASLAAGLHPLIEQRYYLPALSLYQAWRPAAASTTEGALLLLYGLATPVIMWGIVTKRFFL
jgi:alpha-1,2-glucosyltransferase